MSPYLTQTDDFQLFMLHLKSDNVDAWQGTNNYYLQQCLCHSHENARVGSIRRKKKNPQLFENLFKYIAGFNKSISAKYHPTVQAFSALTIHESFNPK